jgi:Na+/H+ antiporter NhaD/arsenite permease-like protein
LRGPALVGFFLAGLVVLGGVQGWWISPVLSRMGEGALLATATFLTAFNDNAAVTYLASQVPAFAAAGPVAEALRHAVVAGALAGGGLTVIANAPNPAGQSILSPWFPEGVSAWRLFLWALAPTALALSCFILLK